MKFSERIKKSSKAVLAVLLPILSGLFLLGTTIVILFIVNGYSFDITKNELIKTGVLNIETNPSDAQVFINGKYDGNTNRAIPNLTIGNYDVEVRKDGYYTYKRNVTVLHGLATIISLPLIKATGADTFEVKGANDILYSNETGMFSMSQISPLEITPTATVTSTVTATPTPVSSNVKIYRLTHFTVLRSFFEAPRPLTEERMDFELPKNFKITNFSVSPNGRTILVFFQNEKEQNFTALVQFNRGATQKLTQGQLPQLDFYGQNKDNKINWAQNSDYLLIETKTQLISYNIKTNARIILFDKSTANSVFIWNTSQTGIVIIKSTTALPTPVPTGTKFSYAVEQISFNGNILDSTLQKAEVMGIPQKVWIDVRNEKTLMIIVTNEGSYLIGNMYPRAGEYEVTNTSTKVADKEVTQLPEGMASVMIHTGEIDNVLFYPEKFMLAYTDKTAKDLFVFTYNKRSAEHYLSVGEKKIVSNNDTAIKTEKWALDANYVLFTSNKNLWAIDFTGSNIHMLQNGVNTPAFYHENSSVVYLGEDGRIYFKLLR